MFSGKVWSVTVVIGGNMTFGRLYSRLFLCLFASLLIPASAIADDDDKVALKLFGKEDIGGGIAECRFSLWQYNRDPETDRYAYLLHQNGPDTGLAGTAQIKIGDTTYQLPELVQGGEPISGINTQYLFASEDRSVRVHVELLGIDFDGAAFAINEADLTVIQKGKQPFTASAKGQTGCVEVESVKGAPDASVDQKDTAQVPAGIPFGAEQILTDISELPPLLVQLVRQEASGECDMDGFFPWGGARYVVNDYYLLWQIPCFTGAYQGSGVFAVTQNPPQDWGTLLAVPPVPGSGAGDTYSVMNAQPDGASGLIRSTELGRGIGDCGTHRVLRLIDGPGEVLELDLMELRDKPNCDGNATAPESWSLVYRAY
ncbi:hypothetical protein GCM10009077_42130 [Roseibium denhamense]